MAPPVISVLLPARDSADTVDAAVESILGQTVREFEVLAVDDGSRDDTAARLEAWARRDERVRVLRAGGEGLVAALTAAARVARGEFWARMDADDVSLPDRFARSLAALRASPRLAGVGTGVEIFRDDRPPSPNLQLYGRWLNSLTTPERLARERFIESPLCHPSVLLRRAAVEAVGGWRQGDFPEDYALWLALLDAGWALEVIPEVLLRWRDHDQRLTRRDARYRPDAMVALKAYYLARLEAVRRRPVTIWGAGRMALRLSRSLRALGAGVHRLIDLSPRKVGYRIEGWPVIHPRELGTPGAEFVVAAVGAKGAREEIRLFLVERGWIEGEHFLFAA